MRAGRRGLPRDRGFETRQHLSGRKECTAANADHLDQRIAPFSSGIFNDYATP
jgi:hypothetical protein